MRGLLILFVTLAVPETVRARVSDPPGLERIGWLVGTWRADAVASDGSLETTEATYEWASHGRAIRYSLVRKGERDETTLEGICGYHPGKERLVLWEVDGEGNVTEGVLTVNEAGQSHDETIYALDGSILPVRAEILREGEDAFRFQALVEKDGDWALVFERTYRRVRP